MIYKIKPCKNILKQTNKILKQKANQNLTQSVVFSRTSIEEGSTLNKFFK